jgi:23S rRNA (adenine2503-C2)-methyltransferase
VHAFAERLREARVNVTIRDTRGSDIDAACGQLRARHDGGLSAPAP